MKFHRSGTPRFLTRPRDCNKSLFVGKVCMKNISFTVIIIEIIIHHIFVNLWRIFFFILVEFYSNYSDK